MKPYVGKVNKINYDDREKKIINQSNSELVTILKGVEELANKKNVHIKEIKIIDCELSVLLEKLELIKMNCSKEVTKIQEYMKMFDTGISIIEQLKAEIKYEK